MTHEGYTNKYPWIGISLTFFILTKANKIPWGQTIDVLEFDICFMLHICFAFFKCWIHPCIYVAFFDVCPATSYTFGFPSRIKRPPIEILKLLVTTFSNQDNKAAYIWVDEDGSLARSSKFMSTFHNKNIIVQTTGGHASSPNGKSKSLNKTLSNITRALLLNSSHNKYLWCCAYQYAICSLFQTENRLRGGVPYFFWHGSIPSYKHIKIWGLRLYIIELHVTIKKLYYRSHPGYFM